MLRFFGFLQAALDLPPGHATVGVVVADEGVGEGDWVDPRRVARPRRSGNP